MDTSRLIPVALVFSSGPLSRPSLAVLPCAVVLLSGTLPDPAVCVKSLFPGAWLTPWVALLPIRVLRRLDGGQGTGVPMGAVPLLTCAGRYNTPAWVELARCGAWCDGRNASGRSAFVSSPGSRTQAHPHGWRYG